MSKTFLKPLAAAVIVSAFVSCLYFENPEGEPGWRTTPDQSAGPAPEFRRTVPFTPGKTLSLENDYGDVSITGWNRAEVEVVARAATVESQPEGSNRPYRIRKVTPEVEILETEQGLLVRTPTFEGAGEAPAVDYELKVPSEIVLTGIRISEGSLTVANVFGRIEASIDQGHLAVANFSGPLRVSLGTGGADVEVLDLRESDEVSVTTRRGDITLRLEPGVTASVEANAPHGEVTSDFDLGVRLPAPTVKGLIGRGGPSIILMTSEGRIQILKSGGAPAAAVQAP